MGVTRHELEEINERLRGALRLLRAENAFLHGENRRLARSFKAARQQMERMSARYERLCDYVTRLRDWATAAAATGASEPQPKKDKRSEE